MSGKGSLSFSLRQVEHGVDGLAIDAGLDPVLLLLRNKPALAHVLVGNEARGARVRKCFRLCRRICPQTSKNLPSLSLI